MRTIADFVERVVADGIKAAEGDYGPGKQLDGSIAGFNACLGRDPQQLGELLAEARLETRQAYIRARDAGPDDYWYWRCRELEIEWVCNVLSAALVNEGYQPIVPPTVRGLGKAAEILGVGSGQ